MSISKETRRITPDEKKARDDELIMQLKMRFSVPAPTESPYTLMRAGYKPEKHQGRKYYSKTTGEHVETLLLDEHCRRIEQWWNWDTPAKRLASWKYDNEGYVVKEESKKGSGYGFIVEVLYKKDEFGNLELNDQGGRIPAALTIQHFLGNPAASWDARTIVKGNTDGEMQIVPLDDLQI